MSSAIACAKLAIISEQQFSYVDISPSFKKYEYFWGQCRRFPSLCPSIISLRKNENDKTPYIVLKLDVGCPTNLVSLVQETLSCIESLRKFWVRKYNDLKKKSSWIITVTKHTETSPPMKVSHRENSVSAVFHLISNLTSRQMINLQRGGHSPYALFPFSLHFASQPFLFPLLFLSIQRCSSSFYFLSSHL